MKIRPTQKERNSQKTKSSCFTFFDALNRVDFSEIRELFPLRVWGGGKSQKPPVLMFKSLLTMAFCEVESINKWAFVVRKDKHLAQRIGFQDAKHAPGVSTYYDFVYRLLDHAEKGIGKARAREAFTGKAAPRLIVSKKKARTRDEREDGKARFKAEGVTELRLNEVRQRGKISDFTQRLSELLLPFILETIRQGLLGDPNDLTLSIDGTLYKSFCSRNGRSACECKTRKCGCPRLYGDPTANWGYISSKKTFILGHRIIGLVARGASQVELPLFVQVGDAKEGEPPASIDALFRFKHLKIGQALGLRKSIPAAHLCGDLGFDASPFYAACEDLCLSPVIPLLSAGKVKAEGFTLDPVKAPKCPSGQAMTKHFKSADRGTCYRCPARVASRAGGRYHYRTDPDLCILDEMCDGTSKIGPTLYQREGTIHRLAPPINRDSERFQELYNRRGSVERFFSRLKSSSGAIKTRRKPILQFFVMLRAAVCHLKAWINATPQAG